MTSNFSSLAAEIAALRGELAETRRETACVITTVARQDDSLKSLRADLERIRDSLTASQSWLARVAETSEEMLIKAFKALGDIDATAEKRNHTLLKTAERVDFAQEAMSHILEDSKQLREAAGQCISSLDERLTTQSMWIEHLASRVWPNAQAFYDEITRALPQGFSAVPHHRLQKKKPLD